MLRKGMLAILMILVLMTQVVVIAEDSVEETKVQIISPKVGESGKTILNETLFISVYIESEDELLLELVKEPVYDFEVKTESEPVVADFFVEEKVSLSDVEEPKIAFSKSEIIDAYSVASSALEISNGLYEAAKDAYDVTVLDDQGNPMDLETAPALSQDQRSLLSEYKTAESHVNTALTSYHFWKDAYLGLFDKVIFDNVLMAVEGQFPYFEYTHNNIQPGHYKLYVKTLDGSVLEQLSFEVVTEQSIANEILNSDNFIEDLQPNLFE